MLFLSACATTNPPEPQLAAARATVAQVRPFAEQDAPQELATAQMKLGRAEAAMQRGHYEHARILAEQADADARLAYAAAENARMQRQLQAELQRRGQ